MYIQFMVRILLLSLRCRVRRKDLPIEKIVLL